MITAVLIILPQLLRHDAVAADVDAVRLQRAVRLPGRGEHREPRARLEVALAADLVTDDRRARRNGDLLLAVLVFDYDRRAIDARDLRACRASVRGRCAPPAPSGCRPAEASPRCRGRCLP